MARPTILLVDAILKSPPLEPQAPTLLSLHTCGENGIGITDLIGCEEEPNVSASASLDQIEARSSILIAEELAKLQRVDIDT